MLLKFLFFFMFYKIQQAFLDTPEENYIWLQFTCFRLKYLGFYRLRFTGIRSPGRSQSNCLRNKICTTAISSLYLQFFNQNWTQKDGLKKFQPRSNSRFFFLQSITLPSKKLNYASCLSKTQEGYFHLTLRKFDVFAAMFVCPTIW